MIIKKVTKHISDVFIGEGWENWVRVDTRKGVVGRSDSISPMFAKFVFKKVSHG